MKKPELTPEEVQSAVERPDLMNHQCSEHALFYKKIEGKGILLVAAVKEGDHFNIICADWLLPVKYVDEDTDETRVIEIWSEGYRASGDYGYATCHGKLTARNLREACNLLAEQNQRFAQYYDAERMTYWGCRLFDNEAAARRTFG